MPWPGRWRRTSACMSGSPATGVVDGARVAVWLAVGGAGSADQSARRDGEPEAEVAGGAANQDGERARRPDPGIPVLVPLREQPGRDPQLHLHLAARRRLGDPERRENARRPAPVAWRPGQ